MFWPWQRIQPQHDVIEVSTGHPQIIIRAASLSADALLRVTFVLIFKPKLGSVAYNISAKSPLMVLSRPCHDRIIARNNLGQMNVIAHILGDVLSGEYLVLETDD